MGSRWDCKGSGHTRPSLVPRHFEGPGTHRMCMRKVYGAFSSIIRRIPSLYHVVELAQTMYTISRLGILKDLLYSRLYSLSSHFEQTFLGFKDLTKSLRYRWATVCVDDSDRLFCDNLYSLKASKAPSYYFFMVFLSISLTCDS